MQLLVVRWHRAVLVSVLLGVAVGAAGLVGQGGGWVQRRGGRVVFARALFIQRALSFELQPLLGLLLFDIRRVTAISDPLSGVRNRAIKLSLLPHQVLYFTF